MVESSCSFLGSVCAKVNQNPRSTIDDTGNTEIWERNWGEGEIYISRKKMILYERPSKLIKIPLGIGEYEFLPLLLY